VTDKFQWISTVAADNRLSVAERYVLALAVLQYVHRNGDTFAVRQVTIADRLTVSTRTVQSAIRHGTELGYLELANPRNRGRGHHRADEHRIRIPANHAGITARNTGKPRPRYPQTTTEIAARNNTPSSDNNTRIGSLEGFIEGSGAAGAPPPSPLCTKHPHGTTDPCRSCQTAREGLKVWEADEIQRRRERNRAQRAATNACRWCDNGQLLGDDGTPVDPVVRCPHCRPATITAEARW
jgi:hypothetical protein